MAPTSAQSPYPQHQARDTGGQWEGDGCWGTRGHEQWPGLARVTGASPPVTYSSHTPCSLLLLLLLLPSALPHSLPAPSTPPGGRGQREGAPRRTLALPPSDSQGHPGHPRVTFPSLRGRGTRLQLLPSSVLVWMLFWGLFLYPFLPQIFGAVVFYSFLPGKQECLACSCFCHKS